MLFYRAGWFVFPPNMKSQSCMGVSRNLGVPYFGIPTIRILLFRVLYSGPPTFGNSQCLQLLRFHPAMRILDLAIPAPKTLQLSPLGCFLCQRDMALKVP